MTIDDVLTPASDKAEKVRQAKAYLLTCAAVAEAIRELGKIPSGELYALVMDRMSLETYNAVIGTLKRAGLVSESAHMLTWIGPRLEDK